MKYLTLIRQMMEEDRKARSVFESDLKKGVLTRLPGVSR